jgi:hypothetical protein
MMRTQGLPLAAVRDRRSLRKTDLIHAPQHSQATNELCQCTSYGFAPDLRSRTTPVTKAQSPEAGA